MDNKGSYMGIEFETKPVSDEGARQAVEGNAIGTMLGGEEATCDCGLPLDQCIENGGEGLRLFGDDVKDGDALETLFSGIFANLGPSDEEIQRAQHMEVLKVQNITVANVGALLERLTEATLTYQQQTIELVRNLKDFEGIA